MQIGTEKIVSRPSLGLTNFYTMGTRVSFHGGEWAGS